MRKGFIPLCAILCLAPGCSRKPETPRAAGGSAGAPAAAAPAPAVPNPGPDLVSLDSGALVVEEPGSADDVHNASWLLRGPFLTQYNWEADGGTNKTVVIELPERTRLTRLEFDTAMIHGSGARDIAVEMSDTSAATGYSKIADVSLQDGVDNQVFPVGAQVPGHWVRLNVRNGYAPGSVGLNRFRARGTRLTGNTPFADVSGTYATAQGAMHIRQEGTSVTGCYEEDAGTFDGGVEGRVVKLNWHSKSEENPEGSAILVFSSDAQRFVELFSYKGEELGEGRFWPGTRRSKAIGTCPGWAGGIEQQMAKDIEQFGRARVYGINFDSDSDRIRDESRPTLDHVTAMLKAKPQWNITIEGHTDSTAGAQHNQDLSERRARSVGQYLQNAGIAAVRLNTVGYGATRPVGNNDTALGRAQNRRVELVKR